MDGFDAGLAKTLEVFGSPVRRPHVRMIVVFARVFFFFFIYPRDISADSPGDLAALNRGKALAFPL